MIGVSTRLFDIDGAMVFKNTDASDDNGFSRRITRSKTLDADVSIYDGGYSAGDRTIILVLSEPTTEQFDFLQRVITTHSLCVITTRHGVYEAAFEKLDLIKSDNQIRATFLVKQALS